MTRAELKALARKNICALLTTSAADMLSELWGGVTQGDDVEIYRQALRAEVNRICRFLKAPNRVGGEE